VEGRKKLVLFGSCGIISCTRLKANTPPHICLLLRLLSTVGADPLSGFAADVQLLEFRRALIIRVCRSYRRRAVEIQVL
jgi:hypothetical protein